MQPCIFIASGKCALLSPQLRTHIAIILKSLKQPSVSASTKFPWILSGLSECVGIEKWVCGILFVEEFSWHQGLHHPQVPLHFKSS
jgi:hypothetical protein